jgi:peptide/nickel transport system substrate-binding protein
MLAALVVLVLLASCSSAVDELRNSSGTAREGGVIKIGALNDIVPTSIFTNSSDAGNVLIGNVYDSLVDYPLDSVEPQPSLATSWEQSKNGTQLTLQLRDGVTFHSGRPFTSKDVEFSIKTWADPTWTVQLQRTAAAITGFDTSKEHEITLTLEHPMSNVFDLLDMMPIIDSETIDQVKDGSAFVGTGPFEFDSWQPGSRLTFSANDDYWGGAPNLDGIEVSVIPDPQAQVSQLRAGQLDMITGASNRDYESLAQDARFDVREWEGAETQVYVGANVKNPALSDVRLRQAIAAALDRDRIVDEVYRGAGRAVSLPWPEYSPAYDAEADQTYSYDLDRARELVAEVEKERGRIPTLPLTYPAENANYDSVAQIVQADLAEIGIDVELDPVEQAQAVKQLIGAEFEGLWILQHSYAQYNPSTLAVSAYPFNADHNASNYVSAGYKEAADRVWTEPEAGTDDYARLNEELLKGSFLLEIAIVYPQNATSGVDGLGMSKRSEPELVDVSLAE